MRQDVSDVIGQLVASRSIAWLRVLDGARLDEPVDAIDDVAEVVEPYRWLLARVGDGVKLTQAGYLPPALVTETMTTLGWGDRWTGKHNREDLTLPVLELRESAQRFGLLRRSRGQLLVTGAGRNVVGDPAALWWHLAGRLPDARSEAERHAGIAYLLLTAAGHSLDEELLAEALAILGWRDRHTQGLLDTRAAFGVARDTWALFRRLALIPKRDRWDGPKPAPTAAGVQLARAALIGRAAPTTALEPSARTRQTAVQLTVTLLDTDPSVWRQVIVPATLTLRQLHAVIQTAMGWTDLHLHLFDVDGVLYGDVDELDSRPLGDEEAFTVGDAAKVGRFSYEYDFGDGWRHDVRVDHVNPSVGGDTPRVVAGARACPPEDSGGPWGYADLLDALADPAHEEHARLLEWVGGEWDAEAFDVDATNDLLDLYDRHTRRRLSP